MRLGRTQPVKTGQRVSDMVRAPQASRPNRSCCSVHHHLQTTELVRRDADQRDVAIVKPAQYQCDNKRLVDGRETARDSPLDLGTHTQVGINKDAKVPHPR